MTKPSCEDTFVVRCRDLKNHYFSLILGPYSRVSQCRPGQFVHVKLPSTDVFFRRAFSVAAVEPSGNTIEIIFKVLGRGTRLMGRLRPGDVINLLGPLGVPFKPPRRDEVSVLVGGGVGFPPLLLLASSLIEKGYDPKSIHFFYGGRAATDILERSRIKRLGVRFRPVTEDGSYGQRGLVTDPLSALLRNPPPGRLRMYACGPEPMLKAVNSLALAFGVRGQLSLEAPMPCGTGICLGCVVPLTAGGNARVCCDGPVFDIGVVDL